VPANKEGPASPGLSFLMKAENGTPNSIGVLLSYKFSSEFSGTWHLTPGI
jgi:hypothetical protein